MKKQPGPFFSTLSRRITVQILAIGVLSVALGFAFNSSNPLGIRWSQPAQAASPESGSAVIALAEEPAHIHELASAPVAAPPTPTPLVIAQPNQPVPMPPLPPGSRTLSPGVIPRDLPEPPPSLDPPPGPSPIKWPETKQLLAHGAVLLDARVRSQYDAGHIPGAISFPYNSLAQEIQAFRDQHPQDRLLIIYCSSQSCSLSRQLAAKLFHEHGYQNVRYMTGGYQEYLQLEVSY